MEIYTTATGLLPRDLRRGDVNNDTVADFNDMLIIIGQFRRTGATITNTRADVNSDGKINVFDLITIAKNWGSVYA